MNTETQHTPGPWKVAGCCHVRSNHIGEWIHESIIAAENDDHPSPCVATVNCREYRNNYALAHSPDPEQLANARLIAAAPELLAALQEVELRLTQARIASDIGRPTLKDADFLRNECERTAAFARQAINKATGN
jgi:hypothetical protein